MSHGDAAFGGRPEDPYPGRRQADDLSAGDLRAQPAWWFPPPDGHLTGPDDLTVMPVDTSAAVDGVCEFPAGRWLLHARFVLADGSEADGHVTYDTGESCDARSSRGRSPQPEGDPGRAGEAGSPELPPVARTSDGVAMQEPAICTPRGQVPLWHGMIVPDAARIARMLALLGRPRESVFPLRWRAAIRPSSHEISGEAAGFLVWRGGRVESV